MQPSTLETRLRACVDPIAGNDTRARPLGIESAAVLVIASTRDAGLPILFLERSQLVSTHRGQIALPGGRLDPGETIVEAAVREAGEEVGLPPSNVEILGCLPPFTTAVSARWLTPVVSICHTEWEIVPDGFEVSSWFWASLDELLHAPHTVREFERDGVVRPVHFYEVAGRTIWGVTGAVVHELLTRIGSDMIVRDDQTS